MTISILCIYYIYSIYMIFAGHPQYILEGGGTVCVNSKNTYIETLLKYIIETLLKNKKPR